MSANQAFSDLPWPTGSRFSGQACGLQLAEPERIEIRHDLVERIKYEIDNGTFDSPNEMDRRIDACLDAVLADVLPNT